MPLPLQVRTSLAVKSKMGATHSFAESECAAFTLHVNSSLGGDPELDHLLPIVGDDLEIFEVVKDGVLLCKLINFAQATHPDPYPNKPLP